MKVVSVLFDFFLHKTEKCICLSFLCDSNSTQGRDAKDGIILPLKSVTLTIMLKSNQILNLVKLEKVTLFKIDLFVI